VEYEDPHLKFWMAVKSSLALLAVDVEGGRGQLLLNTQYLHLNSQYSHWAFRCFTFDFARQHA